MLFFFLFFAIYFYMSAVFGDVLAVGFGGLTASHCADC